VFMKLKMAETGPVLMTLALFFLLILFVRYGAAALPGNQAFTSMSFWEQVWFSFLFLIIMIGIIATILGLVAFLKWAFVWLATWLTSNWHQAQEIVGGR